MSECGATKFVEALIWTLLNKALPGTSHDNKTNEKYIQAHDECGEISQLDDSCVCVHASLHVFMHVWELDSECDWLAICRPSDCTVASGIVVVVVVVVVVGGGGGIWNYSQMRTSNVHLIFGVSIGLDPS